MMNKTGAASYEAAPTIQRYIAVRPPSAATIAPVT